MSKATNEIADYYGLNHQLMKLIEECVELSDASFKMIKHDGKDKEHLIEELADVEVVMMQIKYLLGVDEDVKTAKLAKIKRQLRRIHSENKKKGVKVGRYKMALMSTDDEAV